MPNRSDGNRQDNRQRGNAAQLLEKYKAMARDAQLAGDRVQTEYYLQFADHYFRVLEDGRSRFEEQNQRRSRNDEDEDEGEETASAETQGEYGEDESEDERPARRERSQRPERPEPRSDRNEQRPDRNDQRPVRAERNDNADRSDRPARPERTENADRAGRPERSERPERGPRPERTENSDRPRRERSANVAFAPEGEERIAVSVLPPAIGIAATSDDDGAVVRPRRRVRKPRDTDSDDIAPAA
jgi:hypothetical protein